LFNNINFDINFKHPSVRILNAARTIHEYISLNGSNLIRDRKFHLTVYNQCVVGSELVDWLLLVSPLVHSRSQAVDIFQVLVEEGALLNVTKEHCFKDKYLFYRFTIKENKWIPDNIDIKRTQL
jgi:Rap guanine nucleotide exchange factor 4